MYMCGTGFKMDYANPKCHSVGFSLAIKAGEQLAKHNSAVRDMEFTTHSCLVQN